ncbi:hypothetical protein L3i22_086380 [Actinoplanes sp. L3-i22]|nr:hypothetical protein L3i22_086380 [Actinoplanes sp. L3-i22]
MPACVGFRHARMCWLQSAAARAAIVPRAAARGHDHRALRSAGGDRRAGFDARGHDHHALGSLTREPNQVPACATRDGKRPALRAVAGLRDSLSGGRGREARPQWRGGTGSRATDPGGWSPGGPAPGSPLGPGARGARLRLGAGRARTEG